MVGLLFFCFAVPCKDILSLCIFTFPVAGFGDKVDVFRSKSSKAVESFYDDYEDYEEDLFLPTHHPNSVLPFDVTGTQGQVVFWSS